MFSNYLIGLREGLEAALIVAILVAYLVRTGNGHAITRVWQGVAAAVLVSIGMGVLLALIEDSLGETIEPAFAGAMSLVAVGLITWMVFWMKKASRNLRGELHGRVELRIKRLDLPAGGHHGLARAREDRAVIRVLGRRSEPRDPQGVAVLSAAAGDRTYQGPEQRSS